MRNVNKHDFFEFNPCFDGCQGGIELRYLLISVFVLLFFGCAPIYRFAYDFSNVPTANSGQTYGTVLIAGIKDERKPYSGDRKQANQCSNSEQHYLSDSISFQLAQTLGAHLVAAKIFSSFTLDTALATDYVLSATVKAISGKQGVSTAQQVGMQFGIIGALATSGLRTDGEVTIEFEDIEIWKNGNILAARLPSFKKVYREEMSADPNCFGIYAIVNEKLMQFFDELCKDISKRLADPDSYFENVVTEDNSPQISTIIMIDDVQGTGYIDNISLDQIVYRKSIGEKAVKVSKKIVKFVVTNGDTVYNANR